MADGHNQDEKGYIKQIVTQNALMCFKHYPHRFMDLQGISNPSNT